MRSILFKGLSIFAILTASPLMAQSINISNIKLGAATDGILDSKDGTLDADGSFIEIFKLDVKANQIITASVISNDFNSSVSIGNVSNGDDCEECGFATGDKGEEAIATYVTKIDGPVFVRINTRDAGEKGKFKLTVTARDPNKAVRIPLSFGKLAQGKLDEKDAEDDEGNLFDSYTIKLGAGQKIQIDLTSTDFDSVVKLQGPDSDGVLVELADNDDSGPGTNARIRFTTKNAGDYRVKVAASGDEKSGAYTLLLGNEPIRLPLPKPRVLALGTSLSGIISDTGPTIELDDEDVVVQNFELNTIAGKNYIIDVKSDDTDPSILIGNFNASGVFESVKDDDDGGDNDDARLRFKATETGKSIVLVRSVPVDDDKTKTNWSAAYTIIANEAIIAPIPSKGTALKLNTPVSDSLNEGGLRDSDNRLYKIYEIDLKAGQDVTISMDVGGEDIDNNEIDPLLQIGHGTPASFEKLAEDDDGGKDVNAKLKFTAKDSGTYLIRALTASEQNTGAYSLQIINTPPTPAPPTPIAINIGETKTGELTENDAVYGEDEYAYDLFSFNGASGQTYIIELISDDIDSYVAAKPVSASDSAYKTDDDSGEGNNAKLEYKVEISGKQIIRVSSSDSDEIGKYSLKISQ